MKKATIAAATTTFSLTNYPASGRDELEVQIIARAVELWRKKRRHAHRAGRPGRNC